MKEIFRTFTQIKVDILQQYRFSKPNKNPCNCYMSLRPRFLSCEADSSWGANIWETRMQTFPALHNGWMKKWKINFIWRLLGTSINVQVCVSLLQGCFVCGCEYVTQRRLTKTGSDQGAGGRQSQTGSRLCSWFTNSSLTGWGSLC